MLQLELTRAQVCASAAHASGGACCCSEGLQVQALEWGAGRPAHLVAVEAAAPKADVVGVLDRPEYVQAVGMALSKALLSRLRGGDA